MEPLWLKGFKASISWHTTQTPLFSDIVSIAGASELSLHEFSGGQDRGTMRL
jgi:hypothetical protein